MCSLNDFFAEQNVERTFLVNNCQKLKALIQESNAEVECLRCKTEVFIKF